MIQTSPMSIAHHVGKEGEDLACQYLRSNGYEILERNWRYQKAELDIVARSGEVLVFVEVKTRSSLAFGQPEDFVSARQQELIISAAGAFMEEIEHEEEVRFDIISIYWPLGHQARLNHLEDAFFPGLEE